MAIGLIYKPEFQSQMDTITRSIEFTTYLATLVDIQMFMQEKKDGVITKSDPLTLDPCSTLDLDSFYKPRSTSQSFFDFMKNYKPMQCIDE